MPLGKQPATPAGDTPANREADADEARKSTQAQFSTYSEMPEDQLDDTNPPPGRHVIQELGEAKEEDVTVQGKGTKNND